ncbi:lipase [Acetobacter aceti]|uniref:Fungal lipase-like domain-containing protein n=1 Tax=Acetobacter aceti TaxID=435 RepID=A0A6S6PIP3_ACEAC|nr:lipase [Acetobacter aceti]BCI66555.1 hypothetical protein AAJCM20276_11790 [Acetobacter aceti]
MSNLIADIWNIGRNIETSLIQSADDFLNDTGINQIWSSLAALPSNILDNTTPNNLLTFLNDDTAIPVPTHQNLNQTPTVSQFLNAANTEYALTGTPNGMSPFLVNGQQLAVIDEASGMSAKVWVTDNDQVIIAFQGTGGGFNAITNPAAVATGFLSDVQIWNQSVSQAQKDALSFTHYVVDMAQKQDIDTNNIFVTGHSLGGIEASYVAQQTGLGGIAFEPTGIPSSTTAKGDGSNFASVVTYGDPVGEYANDTMPGSSFVTSMPVGAAGDFNHYGQVVMLGNPADNAPLAAAVSNWNASSIGNVGELLSAASFAGYHLPGTQAADMGITMTPYVSLGDTTHYQSGAVFNVGNDSIAQLLTDNADRTSSLAS